MRWNRLLLITAVPVMGALFAGCAEDLRDPAEIVARSLAAHGGAALTDWETMTIEGTVTLVDGVAYDAQYLLFAQKPDKLRIEHDFTQATGRFFYVYFYNGGTGWMQRNLLPSYRPELAQRHERRLHQCDGIGWYAENARFSLKSDGEVDGRSVYVLDAIAGDDTTEVCIDKDNFYFVQEFFDNVTRTFSDFTEIDGRVLPTKVLEITETNRGTSGVPYTFEKIRFNVPIDPALFTEDMPR